MIYLDNAATTLHKPQSVARAVYNALTKCTSAGRGGHSLSLNAAQVIHECREEAAKLFCTSNPEQIIFTLNATHALNIAIKSVLKKGGTVVTSGLEHNAVMRPLHALSDAGVTVKTVATPLFEPEMAAHTFEQAILQGADCVICTHVSNVFGYILPIERIDGLCYQRGIPLIIDAAQSAGCVPIDASKLKSTVYICMPGHKGLYGPQGTGILICPEGVKLSTLLEGGTGGRSIESTMPDFLPDRLEAGTHNTPGIAGLCKGISFVQKIGVQNVLNHCRKLIEFAAEELSGSAKFRVYSSPHMFSQAGVLSLTLRDIDPVVAAEKLAHQNIAVRAGLHCAPLAHKTVGTFPAGTLRISVSTFSTRNEIRTAIRALQKM